MSQEVRVVLWECLISVILILTRFSPIFGESLWFYARYPRIADRLQSWGDQPVWIALLVIVIGGSSISILGDKTTLTLAVIALICVVPLTLYFWRKAYVEAKAGRARRRERELNALMHLLLHDLNDGSMPTPIDETLILDDSEPGHLPRV